MSSLTPERIVNARFKNHINAQYVIDASAKSAPQVSQSKNINSTVSDTVIATDKNTLLDNESLGNIVTPEVRYKWGTYDSCQFEENLSLVYEKMLEKEFTSVTIRSRWKTIYRGKNQAGERVAT